jgi:ankyrin repeat protein
MVKLLVENGASVSANDTLGKTPLHCAAERGHVRVAKLFLRRNASLSLESNNGWTPLYSAAFQGQQEMVCVLLQKGADPQCLTITSLCQCKSRNKLVTISSPTYFAIQLGTSQKNPYQTLFLRTLRLS